MTTPAESTSETVRRHATAFVRSWPERDPASVPHPEPEVRATRVELDDLEAAKRLLADPPGPVLTAARAAIAGRWTWTADYACGRVLGRSEVVSESLVLRARRQRAYPWSHERVVAVWRRTGGAGSWTFEVAFRWARDGRATPRPVERLTAAELGWWLKTGATGTENPRPPKKSARRDAE